jgi:hypothetical protein
MRMAMATAVADKSDQGSSNYEGLSFINSSLAKLEQVGGIPGTRQRLARPLNLSLSAAQRQSMPVLLLNDIDLAEQAWSLRMPERSPLPS